MSIPRGLSPEEQTAWAKLAQSVTPLEGRSRPGLPKAAEAKSSTLAEARPLAPKRSLPVPGSGKLNPSRSPQRPAQSSELDSHWDRKLKAGQVAPDFTLDLHGHSLDTAYHRITTGLDQAKSMGARVVLVIAGRERPVDPADRATKRGAIRAKLLDWIAASHHADAVAAVRKAHRRHGGEGALYLVLKRRR
ncbi:MAG: Smr/MutS family protein [Erythrobacter sp.]|nr:Smr/MutS family protein [Erythrobacter sp.]